MKLFKPFLFATIAASLFFASDAIAQIIAPAAPNTTVGLGGFFSSLRPLIEGALATVATAIIGWIGMTVQRWIGFRIEQQHRDALHSAIMTGVSAALNYAGERAADIKIDVRNKIIADGIRYVEKSVPDALRALNVTDDTLVQLASSKLAILTEAPASIPIGTPPSAK